MAIQVQSESVTHPVTSGDPIGIEHRQNLEHIVLQQFARLRIVKVGQLVENALKHVGSGSCPAVRPAYKEDHWLVSLDGLPGAQRELIQRSSFDTLG